LSAPENARKMNRDISQKNQLGTPRERKGGNKVDWKKGGNTNSFRSDRSSENANKKGRKVGKGTPIPSQGSFR